MNLKEIEAIEAVLNRDRVKKDKEAMVKKLLDRNDAGLQCILSFSKGELFQIEIDPATGKISISSNLPESRQEAHLLLLEAHSGLKVEEKKSAQARADLLEAKKLLESELERNRADKQLPLQLALVYFYLGESYLEKQEQNNKKSLDSYHTALDYLEKSRNSKESDETVFFEGVLHEKMAGVLSDLKESESVQKELKKAISSFEAYLQLPPVKVYFEMKRLALRSLIRDFLQLALSLESEKRAEEAAIYAQKLLSLLSDLQKDSKPLDFKKEEPGEKILLSGKLIASDLLAKINASLDEKQQELYKKKSEQLIAKLKERGITAVEAILLFYDWLNLAYTKPEKDELGMDGFKEPKDLAGDFKDEQAGRSNDEPLKEQGKLEKQEIDRIRQLVRRAESLEEARTYADMAKAMARDLLENPASIIEEPGLALALYDMAMDFQVKGLLKDKDFYSSALDLLLESAKLCERCLKKNLGHREKVVMENFLGLISYEAFRLGIELGKEPEFVDPLFVKALKLFEDLEKRDELKDELVYCDILSIQRSRLWKAGKEAEAEKAYEKMRELLDTMEIQVIE